MTQSTRRALRIYAGPKARAHIREHGLLPEHIHVVPGAAGGPKGLILGPIDRFLFGSWLPKSNQPIHLVGASIGAWRMATACLASPIDGFIRLERDYVHQHYPLAPGQKRPSAQQVSESFQSNLESFYSGHISEVLHHPRYRLHVLCSRGNIPFKLVDQKDDDLPVFHFALDLKVFCQVEKEVEGNKQYLFLLLDDGR